MLQIVCDESTHILGVAGVVAGAYDEQRRMIRYVVACGGDASSLTHLIPPPDAPAPPMPLLGPADPGSVVVLGLWRDERPVGALVLLLPAGQAGLSATKEDLLRILADLAAQAVVNAIRLASARSRAADMEAINTLGRALAETLELERIYELLYEVALTLLPEVAGAIFSLFDAENQQITCAFAILEGERFDPAELPPLPLAPPGKGIQSNVIHTRQPVIVGSFEELTQRTIELHEVGSEGEMTESSLFVPMIARERVVGVLQVQSFTPGCYSMAHAAMLGLAANVAAVAIENARLVSDLRRSNSELRQAYDSTLEGWSHALDLRDEETQGHSQRVTDLAVRLARAAGLSDEQVAYVRWGALLHDIGKVKTRTIAPDGEVHFFAHAEVGARMFDKMQRRLAMFAGDDTLREEIRFLILHHLRAAQYDASWTDSAVRRFSKEIGPYLEDLLCLSRADITTKRPEKKRRGLRQIDDLAERVRAIAEEDARVPPLPKGLGTSIGERFRIPPSPALGAIMRALTSAVEAGEVPERQPADVYLDFLAANAGRFGIPT
jgi:putative nucleotidyltransferase with HDIG domain